MPQDPGNSEQQPPASRADQPPGKGPRPGSAAQALLEAEKMIQVALLIPAGTLIGWLIGAGLDRWLHQTWIYIAGLLLGAAAGFVQMFRTVLQNTKD